MRGCSRFPPSCSGTPATSVCCSSPGLGSFLRPWSAESWAPRIGRRTESGTYFNNTLTRRNETVTDREQLSGDKESPSGKTCSVRGDLKRLRRHGPGGSLLSIYNVARITWPERCQWTPHRGAASPWTQHTPPPDTSIKGRVLHDLWSRQLVRLLVKSSPMF